MTPRIPAAAVAAGQALDAQAAFLTKAQETLRQARDEGGSPLGQKMLRTGAGMIDGHEFMALPEAAQEDLLALYAQAMTRVSGSLMP